MKTTAIGAAGLLVLKGNTRGAYAFYNNGPKVQLFNTNLRGIEAGTGIPVAAPDGYRYWQLGNVFRSKPFVGPSDQVQHYTINVNQFTDELYPGFTTHLWGYHPSKILAGSTAQKHLGSIIVARRGTPTQLTFRNNLPTVNNSWGQIHILPVDKGYFFPDAAVSQNKLATHLHGGFVPWVSDGGPYDWWGPDGMHGMSFLNNSVLNPKTLFNPGAAVNEAEYYYPNDQSARLMWYHDHAHDITRLNAYAGIASAYIIRDSFEDYLVTQGLPAYIENGGREIPLIFQDKIFVDPTNIDSIDPTWPGPKTKGALWYPHDYLERWGPLETYHPSGAPPDPSVIPEMFGDTMLVNGTVFPKIQVEARRYRFRILNACNARFLNLQLYVDDGSAIAGTGDGITLNTTTLNPTNAKGPDFFVLGTEGGFLPKPTVVPSNIPLFVDPNDVSVISTLKASLLTAPAERWDLIVDFTGFTGKSIILYNDAPAPFAGGDPLNDYFPGNPDPAAIIINNHAENIGPNTRVLMRFDVKRARSVDAPLKIDAGDNLNALANSRHLVWNDPLLVPMQGSATLPPNIPVRKLTLNETADQNGRLIQMVGTNIPSPYQPDPTVVNYGLFLTDAPTEVVGVDETEIWEIANLTADVHPMHFHLVNVQILNREPFSNYAGGVITSAGSPMLPPPTEWGWKETVKMYPNTVTRIIMKFKMPDVPFNVPTSPRTGGNEYVYHCHILEHEEHDMMRPLVVLDKLNVLPPLWATTSLLGGKTTYKVNNFVAPIAVTSKSSIPSFSLPASWLNVDPLNGTFTVTVPKKTSVVPKPGVTITFTVTDGSSRTAANKTDTAQLIITHLI